MLDGRWLIQLDLRKLWVAGASVFLAWPERQNNKNIGGCLFRCLPRSQGLRNLLNAIPEVDM